MSVSQYRFRYQPGQGSGGYTYRDSSTHLYYQAKNSDGTDSGSPLNVSGSVTLSAFDYDSSGAPVFVYHVAGSNSSPTALQWRKVSAGSLTSPQTLTSVAYDDLEVTTYPPKLVMSPNRQWGVLLYSAWSSSDNFWHCYAGRYSVSSGFSGFQDLGTGASSSGAAWSADGCRTLGASVTDGGDIFALYGAASDGGFSLKKYTASLNAWSARVIVTADGRVPSVFVRPSDGSALVTYIQGWFFWQWESMVVTVSSSLSIGTPTSVQSGVGHIRGLAAASLEDQVVVASVRYPAGSGPDRRVFVHKCVIQTGVCTPWGDHADGVSMMDSIAPDVNGYTNDAGVAIDAAGTVHLILGANQVTAPYLLKSQRRKLTDSSWGTSVSLLGAPESYPALTALVNEFALGAQGHAQVGGTWGSYDYR